MYGMNGFSTLKNTDWRDSTDLNDRIRQILRIRVLWPLRTRAALILPDYVDWPAGMQMTFPSGVGYE
jgi:hypothetical protein